jgi:transcriptional regulator
MSRKKVDAREALRGSLELMVLRTLETVGPFHGYALARRIEQVAGGPMRLSQGAIYPVLMRLERRGWIRTKWGLSETNRKVKFYELTRAGATQLQAEIHSWEQSAAMMARFLGVKP